MHPPPFLLPATRHPASASICQSDTNASSMAQRFRDLSGLKPLLDRELGGIEETRRAVMDELERLGSACHGTPAAAFVEQVRRDAARGREGTEVLVAAQLTT